MTKSMYIVNVLAFHAPTAIAYRLELSPSVVCVWTDDGVGFFAGADRVTVFRGGPDWSEAVV